MLVSFGVLPTRAVEVALGRAVSVGRGVVVLEGRTVGVLLGVVVLEGVLEGRTVGVKLGVSVALGGGLLGVACAAGKAVDSWARAIAVAVSLRGAALAAGGSTGWPGGRVGAWLACRCGWVSGGPADSAAAGSEVG